MSSLTTASCALAGSDAMHQLVTANVPLDICRPDSASMATMMPLRLAEGRSSVSFHQEMKSSLLIHISSEPFCLARDPVHDGIGEGVVPLDILPAGLRQHGNHDAAHHPSLDASSESSVSESREITSSASESLKMPSSLRSYCSNAASSQAGRARGRPLWARLSPLVAVSLHILRVCPRQAGAGGLLAH